METQKDFAKKFGVTRQHLNAVLKKRVQASAKLAREIEQEMGIPKWELRPDIYDPPSDSTPEADAA